MATPLCELVAALKELGLGCLAGASVLCWRSLSGLNRHFSQGFSRLSLAPLDGQCILSSGMGQGRSWESHPRPFRWEKISENSRPSSCNPDNSAQVTPLSSDLSSSLTSVTCSSGAWQTASGQRVGAAACPEAIWQLMPAAAHPAWHPCEHLLHPLWLAWIHLAGSSLPVG